MTSHDSTRDKMRDKLKEQLYFDFYGELLSNRLKTVLSYYYNDDYSAPEIAEIAGMTRQGAYDALKRGRRQLYTYESKLGLVARFERGRALLTDMAEALTAAMHRDSVTGDAALQRDLSNVLKQIKRFADEF